MTGDGGSGPDRPDQDPSGSAAGTSAAKSDGDAPAPPPSGAVRDVPVIAANVRWERPTARSFWNSLADPEREALAAAGVEEVFRAGSVLYREGDDSSR